MRIEDEKIRSAPVALLEGSPAPEGTVQGRGPVYLLSDRGQESLLAARYRLADVRLRIAERAFNSGGDAYPAGSWIVTANEGQAATDLDDAIAATSDEFALDFRSTRAVPDVPHHAAELPRLGLWVPWADTDMMGWIRYVLDQQEIPYTYLRDEDLRAGKLRDKVDVILYGPFSRLDLAGQIHGIAATEGPMPFRASDEYPSLGQPVASGDITGGPGYAGLAELQAFVESGGVLLTLGAGTTLVLEGGFVRNVPRVQTDAVFTPGSDLRATLARADHPIGYGYGHETGVFRTNLPVYDTPRRWLTRADCTSSLPAPVDARHVVTTWGGAGAMVLSAGMRGADELAGRPAVIATPLGEGQVVTF
jgi:hypothetical protein